MSSYLSKCFFIIFCMLGLHVQEEVIAEDYDDEMHRDRELEATAREISSGKENLHRPYRSDGETDEHEEIDVEERVGGSVPGCVNRWNPYHECSEYCRKRYAVVT